MHGSGQTGLADYKNAEQLKQGGFQPYSVKIGDSYWNFQNVDPLATPLKIVANALDIANTMATRQAQGENTSKSDSDVLAYLSVAGISIAQAVKDAGFTQGINDLFKLGDDFSDPDRNADSIMKFIGKKAQALIPNTISKIEGLFDNSVRDPSALTDYLAVKMAPGLVAKKYDATGHEIKNANPFTGIYGFPDITTQSQLDSKYANKDHQEAMAYLAKIGVLTNKNFTPNYDMSKFAGGRSDQTMKGYAGIDLRQQKTYDGMTYWDKLNQIIAQSGLDKRLAQLSKGHSTIGTPTNKGYGVTEVVNVLEEARYNALNKLIQDEINHKHMMQPTAGTLDDRINKKIADKTGQHDVPSPF